MLRLGLPPHSRWTRGPDQTQHFAWVPLQEAPRHVTPWIPDHSYSLSTVPSLRSPLRRHCLEPSSPFGPPWSIHLWGGSTRRTLRGRHHRSRSLSQPRQGAFGAGCIWRGPPPPTAPATCPSPVLPWKTGTGLLIALPPQLLPPLASCGSRLAATHLLPLGSSQPSSIPLTSTRDPSWALTFPGCPAPHFLSAPKPNLFSNQHLLRRPCQHTRHT